MGGVFLPGGQTQMPLIIRDDLDDDNEEIEDGLFEVYCCDFEEEGRRHRIAFNSLYLF